MVSKILYRVIKVCYLNDDVYYPVDKIVGRLHYGVVDRNIVNRKEYTDYDEVIKALEEGELETFQLFVDKPFLSKNKYIYQPSWYEKIKVPRKTFKNLLYEIYIDEAKPSVEELIKELPSDELIEYMRENKELFNLISDIGYNFIGK